MALLAGVGCWWLTPAALVAVPLWAGVIGIVLLISSLLPLLHHRAIRFLNRISNPSSKRRFQIAVAIGVFSSAYLTWTAHHQDRDFFPKTLDDQSYVIQMRMLAQGKLWMPQHACADFFDSYHLLVTPKYAPAYFPGTALLYVPLILLNAPIWIGPVIISGIILGLLYRVVSEVVDGVAGAIATLLMISSNWFRMLSILVYGQPVALMLGLLMVWAWLRWREEHRTKWALLIGIFAGFAAITRPADAICYALPVGVAMLIEMSRMRGLKTRATTIAAIILGALPFLTIQVIQNVGITGHMTQTPFALYLDRDQPGANFGFHSYDPTAQPASVVPQKHVYYQLFIVPFIQKHTLAQSGAWLKEHLPQIIDVTMPARVMLIFLPIGVLGLARDARRWVLVSTVVLFLLVYFCYPPFVEHYALPFAPAIALCVAMAPSVLRNGAGKFGNVLYPASILVILIVSVSMLPELNPKVDDETFRSPMMRVLHDRIDNSDLAPAVILFRYHPELPQDGDNSCKIEPVYNTDVARPDDAPIIRAHNLGSRNIEIIRYYAKVQPHRTFYLFDRGNLADPMHRLGTARELANR